MKFVKFYSRQHIVPTQRQLLKPLKNILPQIPPLMSRSNKPLAMNTEELINILTYYHLQEFSSGSELTQALQENDYARHFVAPAGGIKQSTFFDTVNDHRVVQLLAVFTERRARQLRNQIRNEAIQQAAQQTALQNRKRRKHRQFSKRTLLRNSETVYKNDFEDCLSENLKTFPCGNFHC